MGLKDVLSDIEKRRLENVANNRAMLDDLLAEFKRQDASSKPPTPPSTPTKKRARLHMDAHSEPRIIRRNPERSTRSSRFEFGDMPECKLVIGCGYVSDDSEEKEMRRLERKRKWRPLPRVMNPVPAPAPEEVTQHMLAMVCDLSAQRKKVYDSINGTTCHQCRQKTIDTKTICRSGYCRGVQGQFCGPCLRQRYGEEARVALMDPSWRCPPCRDLCNCSFCRTRRGLGPTGCLYPLARRHGYDNVMEFLVQYREEFYGNEEKPSSEDIEQPSEVGEIVNEQGSVCNGRFGSPMKVAELLDETPEPSDASDTTSDDGEEDNTDEENKENRKHGKIRVKFPFVSSLKKRVSRAESGGNGAADPHGKETVDHHRKETEDPHGKETADPHGKETADPPGKKTADPPGKKTADPHEKETANPHEKETSDPHGKETADPHGKETADPHGKETEIKEVPRMNCLVQLGTRVDAGIQKENNIVYCQVQLLDVGKK